MGIHTHTLALFHFPSFYYDYYMWHGEGGEEERGGGGGDFGKGESELERESLEAARKEEEGATARGKRERADRRRGRTGRKESSCKEPSRYQQGKKRAGCKKGERGRHLWTCGVRECACV